MVCINCGAVVDDSSRFCPSCGRQIEKPEQASDSQCAPPQYNVNGENSQQPSQQGFSTGTDGSPYTDSSSFNNGNVYNSNAYNTNAYSYSAPQNRLNSDAQTAKIMAIAGLLIGIFVSRIAGIVISALALSKIKKCISLSENPDFISTRKVAKAAVIISSIALALLIICIVVLIVFSVVYAVRTEPEFYGTDGFYPPDDFFDNFDNFDDFDSFEDGFKYYGTALCLGVKRILGGIKL